LTKLLPIWVQVALSLGRRSSAKRAGEKSELGGSM